jgi:hypothetical protein
MKRFAQGLIVGLALLPAMPSFANDAETRGREIARQVYERADGADMTAVGSMVLTEAGRAARVRQLITYRLDPGAGETRSLIRFTAPADIKETGLLTVDRTDGASDQWVYLPALDRSRRIPATRKGGRFVASDIFYEDLQDRPVTHDAHRWLGREDFAGAQVDVLESIPVDKDNSVYGKRVSWVHPGILVPLRVDYFRAGAGEPFKRLTVQRVEQVQDYWTVMESVMEDLESGHQTRMALDRVIYDRDLPQELFSVQTLEDSAREAPHRP